MEFRRRSSVPGNGESSRDDDGAARPDGVARPAGIGVPAADRGFEDEALSFIDSLYGTALKLTRRGADADDLVQLAAGTCGDDATPSCAAIVNSSAPENSASP